MMRVRVRTLGRFEILVNGECLRFGRKTPARPLMLLKFLAARGGDVSDGEAARALWPRSGARGLRCLAVNLHRLRHLLGGNVSLLHREGRTALDPRHVWCDALAFEGLLDHAAHASEGCEALRLGERALSLYRGAFLARDEPLPWIISARERLRARFVRTAREHARRRRALPANL